MGLYQETIKKHEDEMRMILEEAQNGMTESQVRQLGYCLDNIKDCYEIKHLKQKEEAEY